MDESVESEKSMARFKLLNRIYSILKESSSSSSSRFLQPMAIIGVISWSFVRLLTFLNTNNVVFNHFIVFLLGNAIVAALLVNFRKIGDEESELPPIGDDFCDEYMKLNQIGAGIEERESERRMSRFIQRTKSEKVKDGIKVKRRREMRRSVTEKKWKAVGEESDATTAVAEEMEELSNEEFRRRVDEFIEKHCMNFKFDD